MKEVLELGRDDVFKVEVKDSFSFFNTEKELKEKVLAFFTDFKHNDRFVNVEVSENRGGDRNRSRGGGRRDDRKGGERRSGSKSGFGNRSDRRNSGSNSGGRSDRRSSESGSSRPRRTASDSKSTSSGSDRPRRSSSTDSKPSDSNFPRARRSRR